MLWPFSTPAVNAGHAIEIFVLVKLVFASAWCSGMLLTRERAASSSNINSHRYLDVRGQSIRGFPFGFESPLTA
jgi:hypothetical protein